MALPGSLQLSHNLGLCRNQGCNKQHLRVTGRGKLHLLSAAPSSRVSFLKPDLWRPSHNINKPIRSYKVEAFKCHSFLGPGQPGALPVVKVAATALTRSYNVFQSSPITAKLIPAVGIIIFAMWGVGPLMRQTRNLFLNRTDSSWKKSRTHYVVTSFLQPLLLWFGAILMCRALDPVFLPTEAGQVVKERLLNFVRSLSTVLAFAYCLSSVIQQAQKFFVDSADTSETRNMGFQFAGKAVYSAVWVAAFSLFMELLGFSTQKWVTAGGFGTVLLTLAGREIFTNFLSSAMIHATRPFVANEWIRTKIEGYEVSGTVEHVGWWSPTVIRGEDREAIHIPNHKFTVNVVRNLSQKTHWRIKTHLAISHLDAKKIHNIVADMRKVLAKNPQVEQQRLHRRVFLDSINPENQALMILVSCFVKTSHHEEYLCVKETILLDLLRVIGHHRARLATPVRTLQKIYSDAELDSIPFADSAVPRRPLLMIEPTYKINADDKTRTRSARTTGERDGKTTARTKLETLDSKTDSKVVTSDTNGNTKSAMTSIPEGEVSKNEPLKSDSNTILKDKLEAPDTSAFNSRANGSLLDNATQKTLNGNQSKVQTVKDSKQNDDSDNILSSSSKADKADRLPTNKPSKQQDDKKPVAQPPTLRPVLEDNIVLDVALGGSKKTLSIEGTESTTSQEAKEMAACQGGNGSPKAEDRKDK